MITFALGALIGIVITALLFRREIFYPGKIRVISLEHNCTEQELERAMQLVIGLDQGMASYFYTKLPLWKRVYRRIREWVTGKSRYVS